MDRIQHVGDDQAKGDENANADDDAHHDSPSFVVSADAPSVKHPRYYVKWQRRVVLLPVMIARQPGTSRGASSSGR